jgi:hypothetical protein
MLVSRFRRSCGSHGWLGASFELHNGRNAMTSATSFCPNGHPVRAEALFCGRCGVSLRNPEEDSKAIHSVEAVQPLPSVAAIPSGPATTAVRERATTLSDQSTLATSCQDGHTNNAGALFCRTCGISLSEPIPNEPPAHEASAATVASTVSREPSTNVGDSSFTPTETTPTGVIPNGPASKQALAGSSTSDVAIDPGWSLASDGKWYPTETAPPPPQANVAPPSAPMPSGAPSPPPTQDPPQSQQSFAGTKIQLPAEKRSLFKRWWFWAACVLIVIVLIVAIIGAAHNNSHGSSTSTTQAAAKSSTPTSAAANDYVHAYNKMINAETPLVTEQNSSDPTTSRNGINGQILVRDTFDQTIHMITFPASATAEAQKVLSADAALKAVLARLATHVDDTSSYNKVYENVLTAESNFSSVNAALCHDLGLTTTGNSGSIINS